MGDVIRVLRVYEFVGDRETIEAQMARSLGDGTHVKQGYFSSRDSYKRLREFTIRVGTIGAFPEVVPQEAA